MEKRTPISISFCEKCGSKVSSRDEVCSNCGVLPYQDDREFEKENEVPEGLYFENWSGEQLKKYDDWFDNFSDNIQFCKDCGKRMEEVKKYDDDFINEDTGEVVTTNNHPCNSDSPIFE